MTGPALSERDLAVIRSFARRIDPSDAGAHNNLGVLYYQKGLTAEAISCFLRALELDPSMQVAKDNLEIAYHATGYYDKRVAELRDRLARASRRTGTRAGSWAGPTPRWAISKRRSPNSRPCSPGSRTTSPALLQIGLAEKARGDLDAATDCLRPGASRTTRASGRPLLLRRGRSTTAASTSRRARRWRRPSPGTPTTPTPTTSWPSSTATWAITRGPGRDQESDRSSIPPSPAPRAISR